MNAPIFNVTATKKIRVILDGDIACEADDLYAVVYGLMCPKFDVVGLCSDQFGSEWTSTSMEDGYQLLLDIVGHMGARGVPVCRGAVTAIADDGSYEMNEASRLIIDQAMKDDDAPLVVIAMGSLTNIAIAWLACPDIAGRLTVLGGGYPDDTWNFNLQNDYNATNILMDSGVDWYLFDHFSDFQVSLTSLRQKVSPCGAIGEYLWQRTVWAAGELTRRIGLDIDRGFVGQGLDEFQLRGFYPSGEVFQIGDFNGIGYALGVGQMVFEYRDAVHIGALGRTIREFLPLRKVRVITSPLNVLCILQDFFDKLSYHFNNDSIL